MEGLAGLIRRALRLELRGRTQPALDLYAKIAETWRGTTAGHDAQISFDTLNSKTGATRESMAANPQ